jgi:hypothetical protein
MAVSKSFPAKIHQILQNESQQIVQWNESGLSFRIVDNSRFAREIVPKYFRRKLTPCLILISSEHTSITNLSMFRRQSGVICSAAAGYARI